MIETFEAWRRPAMTALVAAAPGGGAMLLQGRAVGALTLEVTDGIGGPLTASPPFVFAGPGDVAGLAPGAVAARRPAPGTLDAEVTRVAHVELRDADLPWRYSPVANVPGAGMRPWLVLVVGTRDEIAVTGGTVRLRGGAVTDHPLGQAPRWAHVHRLPRGAVGRILSPRRLRAGTEWVAVLVPSWRLTEAPGGGRELRDAWVPADATGGVTVPCLDAWTFSTVAEEDDFLAIARRLQPLSTAEHADLAASSFGRAVLHPGPAGAGLDDPLTPAVGGALTAVAPDGSVPPDDPVHDDVATATAALVGPRTVATATGPRWVLGPPRYDQPWLAEPPQDGVDPVRQPDAAPTGWRRELLTDPRYRGAAGLGAWAAIAWQDRISDGARAQAGALAVAAQRVRFLGLGLRASRSQWERHLPRDPVAALAVLGPMLAGLPAGADASVLDRVAGRTPWLTPALFSSGARRMLRPRSALARVTTDAARRVGALAAAAATRCPPASPPAPDDDPLVDLLADGGDFDLDAGWAAAEALAGLEPDDPRDGATPIAELAVSVMRALGRSPEAVVDHLDEQGLTDPEPPRPPCRPLTDPRAFATSVVAAVDPRGPRPVVVDLVLGGIRGLREPVLAEPDLVPELDLPLWSFLAEAAPDWLLPGGGDVPPDRVLAVATNPAFVEAVLLGANHEAMSELRWRNVPLATGWTPLRRFWQRIGDVAADPDAAAATDIRPVLDLAAPIPAEAALWPEGSRLGDPAHQEAPGGPLLVVVLHTELFRRYPRTQVYLAPDPADPVAWARTPDVDAETPRVWPVFSGTLHPELVFFGFAHPPTIARTHWLVLEEPPPGFRFRHPDDRPAALQQAHGGGYAAKTLDQPVRAFFGDMLGAPS